MTQGYKVSILYQTYKSVLDDEDKPTGQIEPAEQVEIARITFTEDKNRFAKPHIEAVLDGVAFAQSKAFGEQDKELLRVSHDSQGRNPSLPFLIEIINSLELHGGPEHAARAIAAKLPLRAANFSVTPAEEVNLP